MRLDADPEVVAGVRPVKSMCFLLWHATPVMLCSPGRGGHPEILLSFFVPLPGLLKTGKGYFFLLSRPLTLLFFQGGHDSGFLCHVMKEDSTLNDESMSNLEEKEGRPIA